jgi:hypothetical protein
MTLMKPSNRRLGERVLSSCSYGDEWRSEERHGLVVNLLN